MKLVIKLKPKIEARLIEQAAARGLDLQAFVLQVLQERLSTDEDINPPLTNDEWRAKFDNLLASLPKTTAIFVDDSRERIYEGRGE